MGAITREALRNWSFPSMSLPQRAPQLSAVASSLREAAARVPGKPPEALDFERIVGRIREEWEASGSLDDIARRDLRQLTWVFFAEVGRVPSLAGGAFEAAFRAWVAERGGPSSLVRMLVAFFQSYPDDAALRQRWRAFFARQLARSTSQRVRIWNDRCREYGLLDNDAAEAFGARLLRAGFEARMLLVEAGFSGMLGEARFVRRSMSLAVPQLRQRLVTNPEIGTVELESLLAPFNRPGDDLPFEETRPRLVEAVLEPWQRREPHGPTLDVIYRFVIRTLGDPRVRRAGWIEVSEIAKAVFQQWLVRETLEFFFALIDATARDEHWAERKRFWMSFAEANRIDQAWLILGKDAQVKGRKELREMQRTWARLSGAQRSHSVLLLRIGGATLLEWSHDGAIRGWRSGNQLAPKLGLGAYTGSELRADADLWVSHDQRGKWRLDVKNWLRRETGVTPTRA